MRIRGSTLMKYVLSYILLLAVSFIGLYFVINFQLKTEYENKYKKEIQIKIDNITEIVSQSFNDIQLTNYLIENDVVYVNARYSESEYLRYQAVNELKKLAKSNELIHDIIYIDIQNNDVIATESLCFFQNDQVFIKSSGGNIEIPNELIYSKDFDNTLYVLKNTEKTFYLFLCPNYSNNYRIIYILSERQLLTLINVYTMQEILAVGLIFNEEVVFSTNENAFKDIDELGKPGNFIPVSDLTDLYTQNTSTPNLIVAVFVDRTYLFEYVTNVFTRSYLLMAAFTVLGILFVFFSMKITYTPLHKLMRNITKKTGYFGYVGDDIEQLSRAFDESNDEKDALVNKINYYKWLIKRTVLLPEYESEVPDDKCLNTEIDTLFGEDFSGIILVAIITFSSEGAKKHTAFDINDLQIEENIILISLDSKLEELTLLISLPDYNVENDQIIARLFYTISEKYSCKIAYSDYSKNPIEIGRLYDKAKRAQQLNFTENIVGYSNISDIVDNALIPPYPYQVFDELTVCLKQFDFIKANNVLNALFQIIDMDKSPMVFVRCILIDALVLLNASMNVNFIKFEKYSTIFIDTLHLCRIGQNDEAKIRICTNMQAMIKIMSDEVLSNNINTPEIIKFVEENCLNSDFSLTLLADHFHVSTAYMSSLFAKKLNNNLSDYVWKIRFEKAKYLIKSTECSLDDVCYSVGYDIPSSFRRKFKQETGISPSEYRKRFSEGKNS